MRRLGQMHDDESNGRCERCCQPLQFGMPWLLLQIVAEYSDDNDTDKGAEEVAEDEGTWLCQGYVDGAVDEDC